MLVRTRRMAAGMAILAGMTAAGCGKGQNAVSGDVFSRQHILARIEQVADWQLQHIVYEAPLPDGGTQEVSDTEWVRGAFFAGVMAAYRATGASRYRDAAVALALANNWQPGPRLRQADDLCITQTYAELAMLAGDPRMVAPTAARLDAMIEAPTRGPEVGWSEDENWSWCDALFMAPPAMAMVADATGEGKYLDLANTLWWDTYDYLYDPQERLWYRDGRYLPQEDGTQPRTSGGAKVFWSRGNGWVFAGLARMLEHMPEDYPDRPRYEQLMREMASRLVVLQDRDGLWRSSLLDPEEYPQPETSGSGFFAYGLAWGVNHGLLEEPAYAAAVQRAWQGLDRAVQPSGKLGWVQQIGYDPRSVGPDDNMEYGAGAFLLAAEQVLEMVPPSE